MAKAKDDNLVRVHLRRNAEPLTQIGSVRLPAHDQDSPDVEVDPETARKLVKYFPEIYVLWKEKG